MRRLLPLVALLGAAPLPAQQPIVSRTLDSGTVVRLHVFGAPAFRATLLAPLTPDAQRVVFSPPAWHACSGPRAVCRAAVPVGDVSAIEVGRGARAGRGALIGTAVGVVVGIVAGVLIGQPLVPQDCGLYAPDPGCDPPFDAGALPLSTLVGAALGAGIETLFGLGASVWERAP